MFPVSQWMTARGGGFLDQVQGVYEIRMKSYESFNEIMSRSHPYGEFFSREDVKYIGRVFPSDMCLDFIGDWVSSIRISADNRS